MIDYFALALGHALLLIAIWRMLGQEALDTEDGAPGGIGAEKATHRDSSGGPAKRRAKP